MLHTTRLTLRLHRPDDLEDSLALWSHPETTRYIGGLPLTREQVWARLLRHLGHWQVYGYGYMVVSYQDQFVGEVGIAEFKRDHHQLQHEAGWVFRRDFQGQGLAYEAMHKLLQWFARPTDCIIHPENEASLKLAHKLGYTITQRSEKNLVLHRHQ
ncbi:GNAT family N-acetyltransferase [bacterium]|nr:GNAT family N-acetyltransferase [bacterium]